MDGHHFQVISGMFDYYSSTKLKINHHMKIYRIYDSSPCYMTIKYTH